MTAAEHSRGDEFLASFHTWLQSRGLKSTRQRDIIAREFAVSQQHVSVEDLLNRVRKLEAGIGYATVYRTLKLMVEAELAGERNFGEGFARYEPVDDEHHDHLICEACGRIVEFHDEQLENRQDQVATELGYRVTHHRHELFGVCAECLRSGVDPVDASASPANPHLPGADLPEAFTRYLARQGLRNTRQRMIIVNRFSKIGDHVSVDDLLARVREEDDSVGYATVYRTLKLLVDAGLAADRHFGDGFTRFEPRPEEHHDHFVNEEDGSVHEFHDEQIELRQEEIARAHGFELTRHRHDLFGVPLAGHSS